ncbi:MAG: hypothetical protein KatS3mg010_0778 [Acidimicrobiia bacterium]|nr:MAG: hypothetical protein KatS3mg010_0778 [Acidimicrobiia bacterium]
MWLFEQEGFDNALRMSHVIVGIMWMGLLWFFNFVQVPAYAEMDAAARNNALDKLTWRALWWFRWAAMATVVFGLLIIAVFPDLYDGDYWGSTSGVTLLLGIIMGLTMAANVWMVIWPNQQIVIANARTVQAGGEANPDAAAAGRRAAMASRQNTIFSLPLLVFMVGASHFYNVSHWEQLDLSAGKWLVYFLIGVAIIAVLELNALGRISGTGNGGLNVIYETHKNAMYTGFALIVIFYLLAEIVLRA